MGFDRLAPHYRWMEAILAGNKLQRCRTAFLDEVRQAQRVLILGEGNGRFLLECRRKLGAARVTCVDASATMLALAQNRLQTHCFDLARTEFVHADALQWTPPSGTFDLIVTHFFLDCFRPDQLQQIIGTLSRAAAPSATWLVTDFQVPSAGLRHYRAQVVHWMMYSFFRLVTRLPASRLTCPDGLLEAHGFTLRTRQELDWGLLHTDLWMRAP